MSEEDARAAYEAIYQEWLNALKMAALYKTTVARHVAGYVFRFVEDGPTPRALARAA